MWCAVNRRQVEEKTHTHRNAHQRFISDTKSHLFRQYIYESKRCALTQTSLGWPNKYFSHEQLTAYRQCTGKCDIHSRITYPSVVSKMIAETHKYKLKRILNDHKLGIYVRPWTKRRICWLRSMHMCQLPLHICSQFNSTFEKCVRASVCTNTVVGRKTQ